MPRPAATVGAAQIQNRGTIGGNVANGSPIGDTPPVLIALDAEITLRKGSGSIVHTPTANGQGRIIVRSQPSGATVYLGRLKKGVTPIEIPNLDTTKTYQIEITPDIQVPEEEATLLADLEGLMASRGTGPTLEEEPEPMPIPEPEPSSDPDTVPLPPGVQHKLKATSLDQGDPVLVAAGRAHVAQRIILPVLPISRREHF